MMAGQPKRERAVTCPAARKSAVPVVFDLHHHWVESGGPAVVPPQRRGFGTRLIEMSAQGALGGSAKLRYPPQGFNAVLQIRVQARPEALALDTAPSNPAPA